MTLNALSEPLKDSNKVSPHLIQRLVKDQDTLKLWADLIIDFYLEGLKHPPWTDERAEDHHKSLLLFVEHFIRPPLPIPDFQSRKGDGWYWLLVREPSYINLTARWHGKSHLHSIFYPLWRICMDRNYRFGILSNTSKQAESHLAGISTHLEHNHYLRSQFAHRDAFGEDFTDFIPRNRRGWNIDSILVQRRIERDDQPGIVIIEKDRTVLTLGMGSPNPGYHVDAATFDDVCDDANSTTEYQASQTLNWIQDSFSLIIASGQRIVVGSPKTFQDAYVSLKQEQGFKVFESPSILNAEAKRLIMGEPATPWEELKRRHPMDELLLWPEQWPWEALLDLRHSQGAIQFRRNQLLQVMGAEESYFPWEWLERCYDEAAILPHANEGQYQYVVTAVDPATAGGPRAKYFGLFTIGYKDERIHWLNIYRARGVPPSTQRDLIVESHERYGGEVVVESNSVQDYLISLLPRDIAVLTHWTGKDKHTFQEGIPSLSSLVESAGYLIPRGDERSRELTEIACNEMFFYPRYESSDVLMCLWMATTRMRTLLRRYRMRTRLLSMAVGGVRDVPSLAEVGRRLPPSINVREALRSKLPVTGGNPLRETRQRQLRKW